MDYVGETRMMITNGRRYLQTKMPNERKTGAIKQAVSVQDLWNRSVKAIRKR